MKKVIALLLVFIMVLALCGCGGNSSTTPENGGAGVFNSSYKELLVSEDWKEVMSDGSRTMTFKEGGHGIENLNYVSPSFSTFYDISWELDGKTVNITAQGQTYELNIFEDDGIVKMKNSDGSVLWVQESNYKLVRENTEIPTAEVFTEIINNDNEIEELTAVQLLRIAKENEVRFKAKYFGAKATVVSEVVEVHGRGSYNGHDMEAYVILEGGWLVEAANTDDVIDLSPGDVVKVTGNIFNAFTGQIYLYIVNGNTTTIEPYVE